MLKGLHDEKYDKYIVCNDDYFVAYDVDDDDDDDADDDDDDDGDDFLC